MAANKLELIISLQAEYKKATNQIAVRVVFSKRFLITPNRFERVRFDKPGLAKKGHKKRSVLNTHVIAAAFTDCLFASERFNEITTLSEQHHHHIIEQSALLCD